MPYVQNPKNYLHSYYNRIFITSALLIAVIIACVNRVEAQSTVGPLPSFAPPVSYPLVELLAPYPHKMEVGDFNNDGKLDVALLNPWFGSLSILLNDGSGGFGMPSSVTLGYGVNTFGIADFNHDGNMDLVVDAAFIHVLHGDGTGHFVPFVVGMAPEAVGCSPAVELVVGDFNHDNNPDIFTGMQYCAMVLLGDGFALTEDPSYRIAEAPGGLWGWSGNAVADFDGDGNLDVLTPDTIFLGDGTGDFTYEEVGPFFGVGQTIQFSTVGDFNGDGKPDIATNNVNVHLNDGTGGFAPGVYYQVGTSQLIPGLDYVTAWDVKTADINGDSKLDLITIGGDRVSVLLGGGDGTFGSLTTLPGATSFGGQRMAIADFNNDGKPDIAAMGADAGYYAGYPAYVNSRLTVMLNTTYQTPVGQDSTVVVGQTTFTFDNVTTGGTTSVTPIDPASIGQVPGGFAVSNSVAYEITTTATFSGSVTLAFRVPGPISEADFNNLAILHNENGTLVDVTTSTPARDYANLTIYATTTSFSPFYLARRGAHIKTLFDQSKAYKSGSTIPVKLQVMNSANANVSSSSTSLVTRDLRLMSGNTTAPVVDSGNANPDYTFRYDVTLGGNGGGYIFNLSTKGLAPGQYVLSFYVGSERSFFYTVKFEVK